MTREGMETRLAALHDESLEDEREAEELRRILETDAEAQAYAKRLRVSNELLREAFDVPAAEPMPAAIEAAIFGEGAKVSVLRPRSAARGWMPVAIAASLALAIGLGVSELLRGPDERAIATLGDAPRSGPLHAALETLASGAVSEEGVQPMLTFRDDTDRPCREFEVIGELRGELEFGIACRNPAGVWHVEIVVAAPVSEVGPEGYAPASGPGSSALEAMLDALGAGPAISPDAEAALMERGWVEPQ